MKSPKRAGGANVAMYLRVMGIETGYDLSSR